jgi:hypothetical protein
LHWFKSQTGADLLSVPVFVGSRQMKIEQGAANGGHKKRGRELQRRTGSVGKFRACQPLPAGNKLM